MRSGAIYFTILLKWYQSRFALSSIIKGLVVLEVIQHNSHETECELKDLLTKQ